MRNLNIREDTNRSRDKGGGPTNGRRSLAKIEREDLLYNILDLLCAVHKEAEIYEIEAMVNSVIYDFYNIRDLENPKADTVLVTPHRVGGPVKMMGAYGAQPTARENGNPRNV